jgi:hypothetical protein
MELLKKLRIDTNKPLWLINAPADCANYFANFDVKESIPGKKIVDQVILFAYDSKSLQHYLPKLENNIAHSTLFWICYPKQTGAFQSDLIKIEPWNFVFQSGFRGQTSISIDDNWTGMRFTNAPKAKPSICDLPMEERKVEGIDFVKRTVTLPADAQAAIDKFKGLSDCFYAASFTYRKEAVMAIADAKKEETRKRRIDKLVEELKQKMHTTK